MKPQLHPYLSVVLLSMFLSSCTLFRFAYSPTIHNVPALKEKNEARINATLASTMAGTESSFSFQGAYAVTDHFALTASLNGTVRSQDELTTSNGSGTTNTEIVRYNRRSAEFGAGVFYPISKNKKAFFELYGGYGFGTNDISDNISTNSGPNGFHNSKTNRFYFQPSISFHPGDHFTITPVMRFTSIGYTDITTSYDNNELEMYLLLELARKRLFFVEPTLMTSFGFESAPWFRIQAQMNVTMLAGNSTTNYRSSYFSVGIQMDPVKAFAKK